MSLPTPYYQSDRCTLYCGDNAAILPTMPSDSVDLVVTSPPYDTLRTYASCGGWNFHNVSKLLTRAIKGGGVIVWVVADQTIDGSETGTSMRHALHFMDSCGLNLHDTMIYRKTNGGANGSNKAYLACWEYMYVFSKGEPATVNLLRDRKNAKPAGIKEETIGRRTEEGDRKGRRIVERSAYGVRWNVWDYAVGQSLSTLDKSAYGHPAIFPDALAADHIRSWSNEGDLVLDPFAGSGTTLAAALKLGRRAIGCEINPAYCAIAARRIKEAEEVGQMFREAAPQQMELPTPHGGE